MLVRIPTRERLPPSRNNDAGVAKHSLGSIMLRPRVKDHHAIQNGFLSPSKLSAVHTCRELKSYLRRTPSPDDDHLFLITLQLRVLLGVYCAHHSLPAFVTP